MEVYRIDKKEYQGQFPPRGSLFSEGRWNTKGMWVVYTSDSVALAKLEVLANSTIFPKDRFLRIIEIKDDAPLVDLNLDNLPENWNSYPYPSILAERIKSLIATGKFVGAIVPSVQSPLEKNILLFPDHHNFSKYIKEKKQLDAFFDARLEI